MKPFFGNGGCSDLADIRRIRLKVGCPQNAYFESMSTGKYVMCSLPLIAHNPMARCWGVRGHWCQSREK